MTVMHYVNVNIPKPSRVLRWRYKLAPWTPLRDLVSGLTYDPVRCVWW